MGSLVALEEYRRTVDERKGRLPKRQPPSIRGGEIWGRDYTDIEAVVFGLLKVRDIAAYHSGDDVAFDHLCIEALEAAYTVADTGPATLKQAIKPLKEWLLDILTEDNKRDVSWAIVLCDLIEKSPVK